MQHGFSTLACVASVSARVSRESWDESKKKGMTGEGEGFPLLPSPSPFHRFFFAPALGFAQELDWKRLLRGLFQLFLEAMLQNKLHVYVARLTIAELGH